MPSLTTPEDPPDGDPLPPCPLQPARLPNDATDVIAKSQAIQTKARRSFVERPLLVLILGLLCWLPLPLGSDREWSSALFVLVVAVAASIWAIALLRQPGPPLTTLRPAWPLLALLAATQAWVATQWLAGLSVDTAATVRYLILGCAYSLLFLLTVGLFHSRKRLTLLLTVLTVSGLFQAFYGSFMTLSHIEWLAFGPKQCCRGLVTGTFVNNNHLAGYLEMTLACGIALLMALRDGRPYSWRSLPALLMGPLARTRLALIVMVIALVMTRSRMGNSAFFISLTLLGGLFILIHRQHRLRNGLILVSILLIDLLVISQFFGLDKLHDKLVNTRFSDEVVNGQVISHANVERVDVLIYALPQFYERPFVGFGAGSFAASFPRFPGQDVTAHYDHAHNDFLQFAIEYGVIGLVPLGLFVLWSFALALKALWRRDSPYRNGVGLGAGIGILAMMIHSLSDFNLQIPANAATFIALCAIAVLANHHSAAGRNHQFGRSRG